VRESERKRERKREREREREKAREKEKEKKKRKRDRHHLRLGGTFFPEHIKRVLEVCKKPVSLQRL